MKRNLTGKLVICPIIIAVLFAASPSLGQEKFGVDPGYRSSEDRDFPEFLDEKPDPMSPPARTTPTLPDEEATTPSSLARIFVRGIQVVGTTVFTPEQLSEITSQYVNRELSAENLEALRRKLTMYYIDRGYITSGAIIPAQKLSDGMITFKIIEGELIRLDVEGCQWFKPSYFQKKLSKAAGIPLNINSLQERLQLMHQDQRIKRIHAELKPTIKPGESTLKARVEEEIPYQIKLDFDNFQSPSVGAERHRLTVTHQNLVGYGDPFSFTIARSEGIDPQIGVSYTFPITDNLTTLTLSYDKNDFMVVEDPFEPLDIESRSEILSFGLRSPVYRRLDSEMGFGVAIERYGNKTTLMDMPFSFSSGAEDGKSTVTALRFSHDWTHRSRSQVIAIHSRLSFGLNAWGSTIHENQDIPDSEFIALLLQFQWAKRINFLDSQFIFRMDMQTADDPLLPVEKISVGGRYSVRGYRENQMVRDIGAISSLEYRVPVIRGASWAENLQLATFIDYGWARNRVLPTPDPEHIISAGLGLRWEIILPKPFNHSVHLDVYWGHQFEDVDNPGGNLQDDGVHFQISISAF